MKCAKCGVELDPGERFCGECGQPVQGPSAPSTPAGPVAVGTCPKCGASMDPGRRFCSSCGYDLMAPAPKTQAVVTYPAVARAQPIAAGTSSSSSRILLIVGLVAVVATFLLTSAGFGLWMWLARGSKEANQNTASRGTTTGTPVNANARETNVSIAGAWKCEFRSAYGTEHGPMVLTQNGSDITGTVATEEGQYTIVGTFEVQKFSFRLDLGGSPDWELTLSPDGLTMRGEHQEFGTTNETAWCSR